MTATHSEKRVLRENFTSNATAQHPPLICATGTATPSQQPPLKPASLLDVARNKLRNTLATGSEKGAQHPHFSEAQNGRLLRGQFTSNATAQQALLTSWGWRVTYPAEHPGNPIGGHSFECYIVPVQSFAVIQGMYPGARIEPIQEAEA